LITHTGRNGPSKRLSIERKGRPYRGSTAPPPETLESTHGRPVLWRPLGYDTGGYELGCALQSPHLPFNLLRHFRGVWNKVMARDQDSTGEPDFRTIQGVPAEHPYQEAPVRLPVGRPDSLVPDRPR